MLLADFNELKKTFEIDPDNPNEDWSLNFYLESASTWIEEYLGRGDLSKQRFTEYYDGTGTINLLLRRRPVYTTPTIQVIVDEQGGFGSPANAFDAGNALTYGDDFYLRLDDAYNPSISRSGILVKMSGIWPLRTVRQAGMVSPYLVKPQGIIQVTYTAGYTVDMLPADIRLACHFLVARLRAIFPLGVELNSDNYEERSVGVVTNQKTMLMALVRPLLKRYKNRKW